MPSNTFPSNWAHCMTYAGIMDKEDWMRTALLAIDNKFAFHPASFCLTRSKTKLKSWLEAPWCLMGMPKYFPKEGVDWNPRISQSDSLLSLSTFGEKNILVFASLTYWPNLPQKRSNTSLMVEQFTWLAWAKRTTSSTNMRWEKAGPLLEDLTEVESFSLHFSSISWLENPYK